MVEAQVKKKRNPYVRVKIWQTLNIILTLLPLVVFVVIQWDIYFARTSKYAFQNVIGLSMLAVFSALMVAKVFKVFNLLGFSGVLFLIFFLIRTIINDLVVISFCAFLGALLSKLITIPKVDKWKRIRDKTETADINAEAMERVVEKIITRSGRM